MTTPSSSVSAPLSKRRNGESAAGIGALVTGHCAGLMDITALPIWIGMVLIGQLALDPQRAGFILTLFLGSVVLSGLYFAPRVIRINRTRAVSLGYALAGFAFASMPWVSDSYGGLAMAHIVAGLSVGCGLSVVHGTMGTTSNPHRTAAVAFTSLSLVSILLMAVVPPLVVKLGANAFFYTMSGIMFAAALAGVLAFPDPGRNVSHKQRAQEKIPSYVWFTVAGVSLLMVSHSMLFGFVERIGSGHGFSSAQITKVLVVSGFVNLIPVALSTVLDRHLRAVTVIIAGPLIQATAAIAVTQLNDFAIYMVATCVLISIVTFTHVFAFGVLSTQDPTGRVAAATPVMIMAGSATGPFVGGILAQHIGYSSLGVAAVMLAILSATSFFIGTKNTDVGKKVQYSEG